MQGSIAITEAEPAGAVGARPAQSRLGWTIAVALAAALLLKLWGIGARPLWLDEGYSHFFSGLGWRELWFETPEYEPHPPLYYSVLKLWRGLFGDEAGALRGLSALAGILTVPLAALAAHELARLARSPRPMLMVGIAAALAALSPRLLASSQDARPYALLIFAYALAIWAWLRLANSFRDDRASPGRGSDWIALGAGTALTLWLHGLGLLYAASLLGALLLVAAPGATRARWLRLAACAGLVLLLYLPCVYILAGRSGDWGTGWLRWNVATFPGQMLDLISLHRFDEPITPVLARILIPILLFLGIRDLFRSGNRDIGRGLLLLILLPPLAAAWISQLAMPVFLPRTLAGVLVPIYLACALAIAALPRGQMRAAGGALAAIFLVNLVQAVNRPPIERWDSITAILAREMGPRDTVWLYPNDAELPLRSAASPALTAHPIPSPFPALGVGGSHPSGNAGVVGLDSRSARLWAERHPADPAGTIWLVRSAPGLFDPKDEVLRGLAGNRRIGPRRQWDDLVLEPLRPAHTP
ncbi:MAG TPA: glycosyltransferase family 39 protein [Allosphingosinicella sp.]